MTEQQKYQVISQLAGGVELRRYEACVMADVTVGGEYGRATNIGFRPLVSYISRANIAMTAPVVQESAGTDAWLVSFVMPAGSDISKLPLPADQQVTLRELPAHTAAAITFSGFANPQSIARHEQRLRQALAEAGITTVGPARVARFNPPWTPAFLRRNEVVIEVAL